MNPHQTREVVQRLRAAYPDSGMDDASEALYARFLSDLPYADVDRAVDELIVTAMRLPTVSRIRRTIVEPELDIPTAEEAWLMVQSRSVGLHELTARAAELLGGRFNIQNSDDPELTRVRFSKVYEELRRKAVDEALTAGLRTKRRQHPRAS